VKILRATPPPLPAPDSMQRLGKLGSTQSALLSGCFRRTETFAHSGNSTQDSVSGNRLFRHRVAVAHRVRARMARCPTRGPCAAVRRGRQAAQRESTRMSTPFRTGRMPVRKARPRLTDLPGRMLGKRQAGCRFLLGTSLLDKQKRSTSGAAGARKLIALNHPSKGNSIARERAPTMESRASCR